MIKPERWNQVNGIVDKVFDYPEAQRQKKLLELCQGDTAILREVSELLEAEENCPDFLEGAAVELVPDLFKSANVDECIGQIIGPYRLSREIGRGGMGIVYEAQRKDSFEHNVAIKLLKFNSSEKHRHTRFLRERQLLASLNHPNIARLFDGGISDSGQPYIVMELVKGQPITEYCDTHKLTIRQRLDLVLQVAEALTYTHQHLIIHRDIKPSNILVTESAQVKLLDFGIAKLVEAEAPFAGSGAEGKNLNLTQTGEHLVTPGFATPEQLRGELTTIATDVYQLGLVLYELLCGHQAFQDVADNFYQLTKVICEQAPSAPSALSRRVIIKKDEEVEGQGGTKASAEILSENRGLRKSQLAHVLKGDLDAITLKALSADPKQRYSSLQAMMGDITSYLENRPVSARKLNINYQVGKFLRRNWWQVSSGVCFLILVVAYAVTVTIQSQKIRQALQKSEIESLKSRQVSNLLIDTFKSADPYHLGAENITAKTLLEKSQAKISQSLKNAPEVKGHMLMVLGEINHSLHEDEESVRMLERALEINSAILSYENIVVADNLALLGNAYYNLGQSEEAKDKLSLALSIYNRSDQSSDAKFIENKTMIMNDLGLAQYRLGEFEQAREKWNNVIELIDQHPAASQISKAIALNNLANLQHMEGDMQASISNAKKAIAINEKILGKNNPRIAVSITNLAVKLTDIEDYDQAESLYLQAISLQRSALGAEHPIVIRTRRNLAIMRHRRGDLTQAIQDFSHILSIQKKIGNDRETASSLLRLANIHYEKAEFQKAEAIVDQVMSMGDDSSSGKIFHGRALAQLAALTHAYGNKELAATYYQESLTLMPKSGMRSSIVMADYARLLIDRGSITDAFALSKEIVAYRSSRLDPEHRLVAEAKGLLGVSMSRLGETEEGTRLLVDAYKVLRERDVPYAPYYDLVAKALASFFKLEDVNEIEVHIEEYRLRAM